MRSSNSSANALQQSIRPTTRLVLRDNRIDFGSSPTTYKSSDTYREGYYDDGNVRPILGDSAMSRDKVAWRAISYKAGGGSGTSLYMHRVADGETDGWGETLRDFEMPDIHSKCRLGMTSLSQDDQVRFWYVDTNHRVVTRDLWNANGYFSWPKLACQTQANSSVTEADSYAVAPINNTDFFLSYVSSGKFIVASYINGVWGEETCLAINERIVWSDAHWFDAEYFNGEYYLTVPVKGYGTSKLVRYKDGNYSAPYDIVPTDIDYWESGLAISGLSVYNSQLWAVGARWLQSSMGNKDIKHLALMRSINGMTFSSRYIGQTLVKGKFLPGTQTIHVPGNSAAYTGDSTYITGNTSATEDISDYVSSFSFDVPEGKVSQARTKLKGMKSDTDALEMMVPGIELVRSVGFVTATGTTYDEISYETLDTPQRQLAYGTDAAEVVSRGPMKKLVQTALPTDAPFLSPWRYYEDFTDGIYRTLTGSFTHVSDEKLVRCESPGTSILLAQQVMSGDFQMNARVKLTRGIGCYLVFWSDARAGEGASNYYAFGYKNGAWHFLRVVDGVEEAILDESADSYGMTFEDSWMKLGVSSVDNKIYCYMWRSGIPHVIYEYTPKDTIFPGAFDKQATVLDQTSNQYRCGIRTDLPSAILTTDLAAIYADETPVGVNWEGIESEEVESEISAANGTQVAVDSTADFTDSGMLVIGDEEIYYAEKTDTTFDDLIRGMNGTEKRLHPTEAEVGQKGSMSEYDELMVTECGVDWNTEMVFKAICDSCDVEAITDDLVSEDFDDLSDWEVDSATVSGNVCSLNGGTILWANDRFRQLDLTYRVESGFAHAYIGCDSSLNYGYRIAFWGDGSTTNMYRVSIQTLIGGALQDPIIIKPLQTYQNPADIRIVVNYITESLDMFVTVWISGKFGASFYLPSVPTGYFGIGGNGTLSSVRVPELYWPVESMIGGNGEDGKRTVGQLLENRKVKMVERLGAIKASRFMTRDDLGSYNSDLITRVQRQDSDNEWVSIMRVLGGEEWGYAMNSELARRGMRFASIDNYYIEEERGCRTEGTWQLNELLGLLNGRKLAGRYDPRMELEDTITITTVDDITGETYIVNNWSIEMGLGTLQCTIGARKDAHGAVGEDWGTLTWDEGVWG